MSEQLEAIRDTVIRGKRDEATAQVRSALEGGTSPQSIMNEALIPAMDVVGEKYASGEFFLPQMMIAARAMGEALEVMRPSLTQGQYEKRGKAVIGTVAGDFHDIGKNIVRMMMEGGGYDVVDLGVDVAPEAFVQAVTREAPRFVLLSSLITLTMENMRKTLDALSGAGLRDRVIVGVGGAPVTQKFAAEIGADFYADNAHGAVAECNRRAA